MTRLIPFALAVALLAAPTAAQEEPSLLEEGAGLMLRGLLQEVAPPLQELAGIGQELLPTFQLLAEEMGPALAEVLGQIDSISYYEPPAILPNGDIVLRRSADAPAWVPPPEPEEPEPEGVDPEENPSSEPELRLDPSLRIGPEGDLEL
jgi:hypothetical protein